MTKSLDNILSGDGEAVGEQGATQQEQVTQAEGSEKSEQQAEKTERQEQGQKMVPHEALHAEKQKVKRYTEEVADFRRQMQESNAQWERRMAQLIETMKPQPAQPAVPDWFENPEARTDHQIGQRVAPQFEQISQQLLAIAKDNAVTRFTEEKVAEAEQAFISALQSNKLDPADYQKVVGSPNRYAAAVQWHQRQLAQAEIGDDPAAFKAKLEAEIEAKVLEKHGLKAGEVQKAAPSVMPSNLAGARNVGNRAGPAWSGPVPIGDIFKR